VSSAPRVHGHDAGNGGTTAADHLGGNAIRVVAALDPRR
jgi:hypothetical protein